jgi:hypothetical protein
MKNNQSTVGPRVSSRAIEGFSVSELRYMACRTTAARLSAGMWRRPPVHFCHQASYFGADSLPRCQKIRSLTVGFVYCSAQEADYSQEDPIVICTIAVDRDQLVTRLAEIKARTKNSIELSRRMIDHSFPRFRTSQRNAVQRSLECRLSLSTYSRPQLC